MPININDQPKPRNPESGEAVLIISSNCPNTITK